MDESTSYLRISAPDRLTLSVCDTSIPAFDAWLGALPRHQLSIAAQQLYTAVTEVNRLLAPAALRFQLLERLSTEIQIVCRQLDVKIIQSTLLDERTAKVKALGERLQTSLAAGYKRVALDCAAAVEDVESLLAASVQRALWMLAGPLLRNAKLYCQAPAGLWKETHSLYRLARQHAQHEIAIADPARPQGTQSVTHAYLALLLFGCARTNQLRPSTIDALLQWLQSNSHLATLQMPEASNGHFQVLLGQDLPPRDATQAATNVSNRLALDTCTLVRSLSKMPDMEPRPGLSKEVVAHLQRSWGQTASRSFNRVPGRGTVKVCIGMASVHTLLAAGMPFDEQLQSSTRGRTARFRLDNEVDVWSKAVIEAAPTDWLGLPSQEVQYRNIAAAEPAPRDSIDFHQPEIVNHSPGGYCLRLTGPAPAALQVGELLAIEDQQQGWSVAAVRWLNRRTMDTHIGIELIAPNARPCGLRMVLKIGQQSDFVRGLLLPEVKALSRPAMLIAPRLPFHEGCKITINIQGEEHRALLARQHDATGSFNRFVYQWLEAPRVDSEGTGSESASGMERGISTSPTRLPYSTPIMDDATRGVFRV
jgi:hypothetical protein